MAFSPVFSPKQVGDVSGRADTSGLGLFSSPPFRRVSPTKQTQSYIASPPPTKSFIGVSPSKAQSFHAPTPSSSFVGPPLTRTNGYSSPSSLQQNSSRLENSDVFSRFSKRVNRFTEDSRSYGLWKENF